MQKKSIFIILLFSLYVHQAGGSDSIVKVLMNRIYSSQITEHSFFLSGMFPSYRECHLTKSLKEDDNIFFTALVAFTLRKLQPHLDKELQVICDTIFDRSETLYKKFQNRRGFPVYSFWMTDPVKFFPNSPILSKFKSKALPDDVDCTAILLQAMEAPDSVVRSMHKYIQAYTNSEKQKIKNSFLKYYEYPAYATWLGYRMPADLDVCVLANVLLLVNQYNLQYTSADSASLKVISEVVRKKEYLTHAAYASPYYQRTPVILYHISRLMASGNIPELERYRPQLINDALAAYKKATNFLDKIILSTSLLRWNAINTIDLSAQTGNYIQSSENDFVFFIATMSSMLPNPMNKWAMAINAGRFNYYCPAYNDVLVLENIIIRRHYQ